MTPEKIEQYKEHFRFVLSFVDTIEALTDRDRFPDMSPSSLNCLASEASDKLFKLDALVTADEDVEEKKVAQLRAIFRDGLKHMVPESQERRYHEN